MDTAATLPKRSHEERIAAIREKAQRHVHHSARVFAPPPPEETDNSVLPVPSLLAVACTAALANQAQGQTAEVNNEAELNAALGNAATKTIVINSDIKLTRNPTSSSFNSININGNHSTIDFNDNSNFTGIYFGDITNVTLKNSFGPYDFQVDGNIVGSSFLNNRIGGGYGYRTGGAVYMHTTDKININSSVFKENKSNFHGGAIAIINSSNSSNSNIISNRFYNNSASAGGYGGAIYIDSKNSTIEDSIFIGNSASKGGAIHQGSNEKLIIKKVFF